MVRCVLTRDDVVEVDGQRGVENEVNEEHEDEDVDGDLTHGQPVKRHAPVGDVQVDALKRLIIIIKLYLYNIKFGTSVTFMGVYKH